MITGPLRYRRRPGVDMHVLDFCTTSRHGLRNKHVVNLLRVLLIHICVPLCRRHTRQLVDVVDEPVEGTEDGARLQVLVHVSS
jgi:hypothetical protein